MKCYDTTIITKFYDHISHPMTKAVAASLTPIIDDQKQNVTTSALDQQMKELQCHKSDHGRSNLISSTVKNASWQNKYITKWYYKDVAGIW